MFWIAKMFLRKSCLHLDKRKEESSNDLFVGSLSLTKDTECCKILYFCEKSSRKGSDFLQRNYSSPRNQKFTDLLHKDQVWSSDKQISQSMKNSWASWKWSTLDEVRVTFDPPHCLACKMIQLSRKMSETYREWCRNNKVGKSKLKGSIRQFKESKVKISWFCKTSIKTIRSKKNLLQGLLKVSPKRFFNQDYVKEMTIGNTKSSFL